MNREQRRMAFRINSTREQRMTLRRYRKQQQIVRMTQRWNREKARRIVEGIKAGNIEMQQGIVTEGDER